MKPGGTAGSYHGTYKEREGAVKLISQPEEDATLTALLEQQFNYEAALLLRLRHPSIIRVMFSDPAMIRVCIACFRLIIVVNA